MYYYHYLPRHDLSAIACATRRVDMHDNIYPFVEDMVRQELLKHTEVEHCFETAHRRAFFRNLLESKLSSPADRCIAVQNALQVALRITGAENPENVSVTEENYCEKLNLLTDLLARFNPTEADISRLARALDKETAADLTEEFSEKHIKKLATQALALTKLAKDNKLIAFESSTTLSDAVDFVMAEDAVAHIHRLCRAGETGEIIGGFMGLAIILTAIVGVSCAAAAAVIAPIALIEVPILGEALGFGVLLGLLYVLFADYEKTEEVVTDVMDRVITTSAKFVGDVVTRAAVLTVFDPDPEAIYL